jgi:hypothetical protein
MMAMTRRTAYTTTFKAMYAERLRVVRIVDRWYSWAQKKMSRE